ncbi:hypothetical protein KIN20_001343 [Parelaphostrongylus tenuis]|uniref:Uncharacterized protein n=1 Tax=Parelaphostrongylus tenuis TaxID=148309 RepID=A0AAD5LTI9_PARTN|nr:hypothetical protein KIN20_001343 [Parelaphostrongylus tenuis]
MHEDNLNELKLLRGVAKRAREIVSGTRDDSSWPTRSEVGGQTRHALVLATGERNRPHSLARHPPV